MTPRYYARSASDRTDDWPWWFVADKQRGGLNVTQEVHKLLDLQVKPGAVLCTRADAEQLSEEANNAYGT